MLYQFFLNIQDGQKWFRFFRSSYVFILFGLIYTPWIFIVLLSFLEFSSKGNVVTNLTTKFDYGAQYISFFTDPTYYDNFWGGLFNSLIIAAFTIPISLFIGLVSVISIWNNGGANKKATFALSNLSIGIPDILQGICFSSLFIFCFLPLGINLGFITVILTHIAFSVPYVIVFLYPKISKIKKTILLASYDLKYAQIETIFKVLIPMMIPNILSSALVVFLLSFDDFIITNLVRGNLTTITSELYVMKRGIKAWAITFGAIIFWISMVIAVSNSAISIFKKNKKQPNDLHIQL